jgi:citrate/tricarballylate utilization protein
VSAIEDVNISRPIKIGTRTPLPMLVAEATRQLTVCNSCRYCEGFCAVFPSLERRTVLERGDISQIANLCHDCRACFDACMYTAPHDFALNIPRALSAVRTADYTDYVWPVSPPRLLRGRLGVVSGLACTALLVLVAAALNTGFSGIVASHASPYALIPYWATLILLLLPAVFALGVMAAATRSYWRTTGSGRVDTAGVLGAIREAATLRYLRGGGEDCRYPEEDQPSGARRRLHMLVMYGFGLCIVSTTAAGVMQDFLGNDPPYGWVSVPVLSGTIGGLMLAVGSIGLLALKVRASGPTGFAAMTVKDYGFLVALTYLAVSGLATLLARGTDAFGVIYLLHLAAIVLCFAVAPYTKFMHIVFRFAALVRDNLERAQAG